MTDLEKLRKLATQEAEALSISIDSIEKVNEGGMSIIRIIADKEGGIDVEDLSALNLAIRDKEDFIDEDDCLEVSSPGIERELKNDNDIKKSIEEYVHIDFENKVPITASSYINEVDGYLTEIKCDENDKIVSLSIKINIKGRIKTLEIEKQNIKLIRKAIKF